MKPTCLFCTNPRNSGEHVFGAWMPGVLRIDLTTVTKHTPAVFEWADPTASAPSMAILGKRSGNVMSRKEHCVCKKCNNGWMSLLEDEAKALLTPLITNVATTLDANDLHLLAAWAAKQSVIWESADKKEIVSTVAQRRHLARSRDPGPFTRVWIGHYGTVLDAPYIGDVYGFNSRLAIRRGVVVQPNHRLTAMIIGQLVVYVAWGRDEEGGRAKTVADDSPVRDRLQQIWPLPDGNIHYPSSAVRDVEPWMIRALVRR